VHPRQASDGKLSSAATPHSTTNNNSDTITVASNEAQLASESDVVQPAGGRQKYVTTYVMSDYNAKPGLAHVHIQLSPISGTQCEDNLKVLALHDSGCAKSIMKKSIFEKLQKFGKIEVIKPTEKQALVSCTGEYQEITGSADILLHFQGVNGVQMSFELNVIIHSELSQDFLLGRDFTGSDAKAFETNDYLFLTNKYDVFLDPVQLSVENKSLCKVPLYGSSTKPMHVLTNECVIIPPFSVTTVTCTLAKGKGYYLPIMNTGIVNFEVLRATQPRLETLPVMLSYAAPNCIEIPLYNNTHTEYMIDKGAQVADIQIWEDSFESYPLQVEELSEDIFEVNKALPSFIEEDEALNEEEKEAAFLDYMRNGYHHPSMTKEVEQKASLTELYLKSTIPFPDSKFNEQFDLKHLKPRFRKIALQTFRQFKGAFSRHACDLGKAKDIRMHIDVLQDKQQQIQKYVPIPHSVRPQVTSILDQMLKFDIIRECNEPSLFCSNLLVTKKRDGSSIRILLDGRLVNHKTIKLPANYVSHPEVLASLVNKSHVTTLDMSDSFFQIELDEESQPLTAFFSPSHGKRFCFKRAAQGLKNSPLFLKLLMDKTLGDMADDVIHYADDIMIATDGSEEQHIRTVGEVLRRLEEANIKVRPAKLNLMRDNVEFLGVVWTKGKISIPEAKLLSFKALPSPNTPRKAKSVICALAYYRKFIFDFAGLAHCIMEIALAHPRSFKWTPLHENNFRQIISLMCKHHSLYLPDPSRPYYVQSDASHYAGAGRLYQLDDEGNERLLGCVSRTFTKTERVYSVVKKEVLALLYTLRTMDFFLRFADNIKILVDAQAILFLRLCKDSAGILLRFSLELSKYEAEIHHVPGVENEVCDVLSRHHTDIDKIVDECKKQPPMTEKQALDLLARLKLPDGLKFSKEEVAFLLEADSLPNPGKLVKKTSKAKQGLREVKNDPKMVPKRKVNLPKTTLQKRPGALLPACSCRLAVNRFPCNHINVDNGMSYTDFKAVSNAILTGNLSKAQFQEAQRQDEFCAKILSHTKRHRNFIVVDGLLFFRFNNGRQKIVLPQVLLDVVIQAKHFSLFGFHFSRNRIRRDINNRYYISQSFLNNKLKLLRDNCLICQFNRTQKDDHTLRSSDYIFAPRATWGIDLIPNLPVTKDGFKAALLAVDLFTGYIQVCPIKDRTTKSLITALERTVIQPFGVPKLLRSDEEPGLFRSEDFYNYLKPLGTKFLPTSVGSPWANSTAERSIRTIKESARNFLCQEKVDDSWDKYVQFFTMAHNQSTSIYGFAPEELMFGYTKPNHNDLLQFWPGTRTHNQYMETIVPEAERMRKLARERSIAKSKTNRSYKNASRHLKQFQLGQIVAHRQLQLSTGTASAMKPRHTGPYVVQSLNPDESSAMVEHMYTGEMKKAHFSNLQIISFHPGIGNRVDQNFDDRLENMLTSKQTLPSVTRRALDLPVDFNEPPSESPRRTTTSESSEPENHYHDLGLDVDLPSVDPTQSQSFGTLQSEESEATASAEPRRPGVPSRHRQREPSESADDEASEPENGLNFDSDFRFSPHGSEDDFDDPDPAPEHDTDSDDAYRASVDAVFGLP
jgi:hypothetical protein